MSRVGGNLSRKWPEIYRQYIPVVEDLYFDDLCFYGNGLIVGGFNGFYGKMLIVGGFNGFYGKILIVGGFNCFCGKILIVVIS